MAGQWRAKRKGIEDVVCRTHEKGVTSLTPLIISGLTVTIQLRRKAAVWEDGSRAGAVAVQSPHQPIIEHQPRSGIMQHPAESNL